MSKEKEAGLIECVVTQGKFHIGRGETVTVASAGQVVKVTPNQYEKFKDCLRKVADISAEAAALKATAEAAVAAAAKAAEAASKAGEKGDSKEPSKPEGTKTGG